jgi:quinoprotein glucose dehydrogenase
MASLASSRKGAGGWAVLLLGLVLALIGLVLTIGGAWLAVLGGSPYYVLAGLGLLVSGVLLARRRPWAPGSISPSSGSRCCGRSGRSG